MWRHGAEYMVEDLGSGVWGYAVQRWGLRCHWELSPIGDSERALQITIYSKLSLDLFATVEPILGVLG